MDVKFFRPPVVVVDDQRCRVGVDSHRAVLRPAQTGSEAGFETREFVSAAASSFRSVSSVGDSVKARLREGLGCRPTASTTDRL